jgi:hypothetical protein
LPRLMSSVAQRRHFVVAAPRRPRHTFLPRSMSLMFDGVQSPLNDTRLRVRAVEAAAPQMREGHKKGMTAR